MYGQALGEEKEGAKERIKAAPPPGLSKVTQTERQKGEDVSLGIF